MLVGVANVALGFILVFEFVLFPKSFLKTKAIPKDKNGAINTKPTNDGGKGYIFNEGMNIFTKNQTFIRSGNMIIDQ